MKTVKELKATRVIDDLLSVTGMFFSAMKELQSAYWKQTADVRKEVSLDSDEAFVRTLCAWAARTSGEDPEEVYEVLGKGVLNQSVRSRDFLKEIFISPAASICEEEEFMRRIRETEPE